MKIPDDKLAKLKLALAASDDDRFSRLLGEVVRIAVDGRDAASLCVRGSWV